MDCPQKYPLQEHWHHTTRHKELAVQNQALDTAEKIEKEETGTDHSLDIADITALAVDSHRDHSRSQQWNGHSCYRSSSR